MTPPIRILPHTLVLALETTVSCPLTSFLAHSTVRSPVLFCTVTLPGVCRNHLPASLVSTQLAPETIAEPSVVCIEMGCIFEPVMDAHPLSKMTRAKPIIFMTTSPLFLFVGSKNRREVSAMPDENLTHSKSFSLVCQIGFRNPPAPTTARCGRQPQ